MELVVEFAYANFYCAACTVAGFDVSSTYSGTPAAYIISLASNSITVIGLCSHVCPIVLSLIISGNSLAS